MTDTPELPKDESEHAWMQAIWGDTAPAACTHKFPHLPGSRCPGAKSFLSDEALRTADEIPLGIGLPPEWVAGRIPKIDWVDYDVPPPGTQAPVIDQVTGNILWGNIDKLLAELRKDSPILELDYSPENEVSGAEYSKSQPDPRDTLAAYQVFHGTYELPHLAIDEYMTLLDAREALVACGAIIDLELEISNDGATIDMWSWL